MESFGEYARRNGFVPGTQVKSFEHVTCGAGLARRTGFAEGVELVRVVRVCTLDDVARQIDHDYFLASAVPGLTAEQTEKSVYSYLEKNLGMRASSRAGAASRCSWRPTRIVATWTSNPYNCVAVVESQSYNSDGGCSSTRRCGKTTRSSSASPPCRGGSRRSGDDCVAGRYNFGRERVARGYTFGVRIRIDLRGIQVRMRTRAQSIAEEQHEPTPAPANPLQPPREQGNHRDNAQDEKRTVHHAGGLAQPQRLPLCNGPKEPLRHLVEKVNHQV